MVLSILPFYLKKQTYPNSNYSDIVPIYITSKYLMH